MAINLPKVVVGYLQDNPDQKFTARQIADWIYKTYPEECKKKQERSKALINPLTTDTALLQQLVAEIGSQRPTIQKHHPKIKTTEGRPRKYYYTTRTDNDEVDISESTTPQQTVQQSESALVTEASLYSKLAEYLYTELNVYSKRIDERRSRNSRGQNGNKWLFPDLVGMEDLSREWHRDIKEIVNVYADKKTKLWSFEVKIHINGSNVREVFFQTVSNSSWANFSYLVASEIQGVTTLKELRMLSSLHGIGFIKLESDNPTESQILIPAKERAEIDWNTANRLVEENRDFLEYIELVRQFYQTGNPRKKDWDYFSDNQ